MNPLTEAEASAVCTGGHTRYYAYMRSKTVDLPCGCQDFHYADGAACYEHAHVECDGTPRGKS